MRLALPAAALAAVLAAAAGPSPAADKDTRAYEMRVYYAAPGKLDALNARFRDHTVKLLEKHGMRNLAYWHLLPDQKDADRTLIYLLAHKSEAAAKASFDAFRKDPDWVKARADSEAKAGGSLTE